MIISCGAALANLLVALRHFGYTAIVEMPTDPEKRDLLARVSLEKGAGATEEEHTLFSMILQRRTNR